MSLHVRIDHGRLDVLVAGKSLHLPYVDAAHEQVRGKTVPESVDGHVLRDSRLACCDCYRFLNRGIAYVVAPDSAGTGVHLCPALSLQELPCYTYVLFYP